MPTEWVARLDQAARMGDEASPTNLGKQIDSFSGSTADWKMTNCIAISFADTGSPAWR